MADPLSAEDHLSISSCMCIRGGDRACICCQIPALVGMMYPTFCALGRPEEATPILGLQRSIVELVTREQAPVLLRPRSVTIYL